MPVLNMMMRVKCTSFSILSEQELDRIEALVQNLLKITRLDVGKHICVEWKQMSDILQIVVEDNGCGIYSEDVYHIFKCF